MAHNPVKSCVWHWFNLYKYVANEIVFQLRCNMMYSFFSFNQIKLYDYPPRITIYPTYHSSNANTTKHFLNNNPTCDNEPFILHDFVAMSDRETKNVICSCDKYDDK